MSQGLMVINGANPAALFGGQQVTLSQRALAAMQSRGREPDEFSAGITGGFGVIGYKGKAWHIKYNGQDAILKDRDPHTGMEVNKSYIEVVLVAATPHLTKTFYETAYVEGSNAQPDCASSDGVKPDLAVPKRQNDLCATCKWNQFGSRVSADGAGRGKACQDTKRMAVVPYPDLDNEGNGGPMLLRIPPASLKNLQAFAGNVARNGYLVHAISTYLFFVGDEAYPQIDFKAARPLTDAEFDKIEAYRKDERVARILNSTDAQLQIEAPAQQPMFGGPPPVQQAAPQAQPVPQQAPQVAPQPTPAPQPAPTPAPQPVPVSEAPSAPQAQPQFEAAPAPQPAPVAAAPAPAPAPVQAAPVQQAAPAPQPQAAPAQPAAPPADFDSFLDGLAGM